MLRAPGGAPLLFLLGVACDEWKCSNEDGVVPRLATLDGDLDRLARKDWAYLLRDLRLLQVTVRCRASGWWTHGSCGADRASERAQGSQDGCEEREASPAALQELEARRWQGSR